MLFEFCIPLAAQLCFDLLAGCHRRQAWTSSPHAIPLLCTPRRSTIQSIIMENTRAHPSVKGWEDPNNSKYYVVVVQVGISSCPCLWLVDGSKLWHRVRWCGR